MVPFKKTVFNMTQVENESLADMIHSCLVHFGKNLYSAECQRKEHETPHETNGDNFSDVAKSILINFDCMFGKQISINPNCVNYEEDRLLEDETVLPVISNIYMIEELDKLVNSRVQEYKNWVHKTLESAGYKRLEFRIIQIGNLQYYFYSIS